MWWVVKALKDVKILKSTFKHYSATVACSYLDQLRGLRKLRQNLFLLQATRAALNISGAPTALVASTLAGGATATMIATMQATN